jgi:hypothetical protein
MPERFAHLRLKISEGLQSRYNRSQTEIFLWVSLMEKDQVKHNNEL